MFYYIKLDDLIPEDHLLRLIHKYVDFSFIRDRVKHLYSHTGRPSIDPEEQIKDMGAGEFIHNLINEHIIPHIPVISYRDRRNPDIYPVTQFTYNKTDNIFVCPQGKELTYRGIHKHSRQNVYRASTKDCSICPVKSECTKEYRISQRMRKKIEELFGEAKEFMGLRRAKFRKRKWIKEQVLMTATAQNIKMIVKIVLCTIYPVFDLPNVLFTFLHIYDFFSCMWV